MDILEQYEKENPQVSFGTSSEECSAITCSVIRLSRGRIQDVRQANYILLTIAAVMIIATIMITIMAFSGITPLVPPAAT